MSIMKKMLMAMGLFLVSICVLGQAQESTIPQIKNAASTMNAARIFLPYSPEVVIAALNDFLLKQGKVQEKKATGFLLSENTLLAKNNVKAADMHFFLELKSSGNPNETTVYLGLESSVQDISNVLVVNYFDLQQAKDYLDNLAIAIEPYAADLQLKLQTKNLLHAQAKGQQLASEGIKLNQQRVNMMKKMGGNTASSNSERLTKQLAKNLRQIDNNKVSQANQNTEIQKQKLAIVLLTDNH
jgi:hypothetical protein